MPEQANQTDDDGEAPHDGFEDRRDPDQIQSHESAKPDRARESKRCRFDDFAMI